MNLSPVLPLSGALIEVAAGCLFLHAAAAKALYPAAARSALRVLGIQERWALRWIVGVEAALGVALSTGWRLQLAVPAAVLLLAVFTAGLAMLRLRGYEGDCGCGGASTLLPLPPELRNALLAAMLVAAVIVRPEAGGEWSGGTLSGGARFGIAVLLLVSITMASAVVEARRERFITEQWEV